MLFLSYFNDPEAGEFFNGNLPEGGNQEPSTTINLIKDSPQ